MLIAETPAYPPIVQNGYRRVLRCSSGENALKKLTQWMLIFSAMASAACGELNFADNTGGKGGGGAGGSTGGGGSSDDGGPKPPTAQGAISIHLDQVDPSDPIHGAS